MFDIWDEKKDDDDLEYRLVSATAVDRVRTLAEHFGADSVTLTTSFGVQSGVMLALVAEACPDIRVLYVNAQGSTSERDLEYGRQVLDVLGLKNFTVVKAGITREDFRSGMGEVGIMPSHDAFHALSQDVFKVQPLKREIAASGVQCLLSGVRRGQTADRDNFSFIHYPQGDPAKAHPILDWSDADCLQFLRLKNIPPHPELDELLHAIYEPPHADKSASGAIGVSSSLRSRRPSRGEGMECGIHINAGGKAPGKDPVPPIPNIVVGKVKCRFCIAAKELLSDLGLEYVEAPLNLFEHLVPSGAKTVPIIYLDKKLIGGYGNLCEHLGVEDALNTK